MHDGNGGACRISLVVRWRPHAAVREQQSKLQRSKARPKADGEKRMKDNACGLAAAVAKMAGAAGTALSGTSSLASSARL
jgi:hypothetical protein